MGKKFYIIFYTLIAISVISAAISISLDRFEVGIEEDETLDNIVEELESTLGIKVKESEITIITDRKLYSVVFEDNVYEIHVDDEGKVIGITKEAFINK